MQFQKGDDIMLIGFQKNLYHNGMLLKEMHPQTEEMCKVAVGQNGLALRFVEEQTPDICLAAVMQNGLALEFVEMQTLEICSAAVKQNSEAFMFIRSRRIRKKLEEKNENIIMHPDMEFDEVISFLGKSKTTKPPSGGFEEASPQKSR